MLANRLRHALEIPFWTGSPLNMYQVQYALSWPATNWIDLGTPVRGSGGLHRVFDGIRNDTERYYRVITLY